MLLPCGTLSVLHGLIGPVLSPNPIEDVIITHQRNEIWHTLKDRIEGFVDLLKTLILCPHDAMIKIGHAPGFRACRLQALSLDPHVGGDLRLHP